MSDKRIVFSGSNGIEIVGHIVLLGHFVIAGVLMRQGKAAAAERELNKGLALEARLAKRAR